MIKSMTGYGKAERTGEEGRTLIVEIRSVNHRYGEITIRLPRHCYPFEQEVKKVVAERLKRGKIEVSIQEERSGGVTMAPALNLTLARGYLEAYRTLKNELVLDGEPSLSLIAAQRDVFVMREEAAGEEELQSLLMATVRHAVSVHEEMRKREGVALLEDFLSRRAVLTKLMDQIEKRAPAVVAEHAVRLKERLRQLLGDTTLDEARLLQEVALMADRSDISEEIVRFASHLQQFDEALTCGEPVGRKMDFLLQEMNREVNTIGSKANDGTLASLVVELKAELEKIREQVQNIE
jgi:uncharacterized protein (TIGR00255 family)